MHSIKTFMAIGLLLSLAGHAQAEQFVLIHAHNSADQTYAAGETIHLQGVSHPFAPAPKDTPPEAHHNWVQVGDGPRVHLVPDEKDPSQVKFVAPKTNKASTVRVLYKRHHKNDLHSDLIVLNIRP